MPTPDRLAIATISGFVICRLLLREVASEGRISFGRFYRRRIRRLLPALSVMLVVALLASMLIESPIDSQSETALSAAAASLWLANPAMFYVTADYFAAGLKPVLLHTWSLAVEEQFYLVFPAILALASRIKFGMRGRSSRRAPIAAVIAGTIVVCLRWLTAWGRGSRDRSR